MDYILASASPRRQELLKFVVDDFKCIPANIAETVPDNIDNQSVPEFLAVKKAKYVAENNPDTVVIGSDTSVIIGDIILGKPKNKKEAEEMLRLLSGNIHTVVTGCAVFFNNKSISFSEKTSVEFYPLTQKLIDEYILSGEPMDKAGAYGIQGKGCLLVKRIDGDFFNVMGLPVASLYRKLKQFEALITL